MSGNTAPAQGRHGLRLTPACVRSADLGADFGANLRAHLGAHFGSYLGAHLRAHLGAYHYTASHDHGRAHHHAACHDHGRAYHHTQRRHVHCAPGAHQWQPAEPHPGARPTAAALAAVGLQPCIRAPLLELQM